MTPERWKKTEELFHAAHARPQGERAAFLAEACPDDEAMRRDVESLLNEPGSDEGFLARPAVVIPPQVEIEPASGTMTGRSLGGYQLQALLGAGGMGEVYRAHDAKLGRDVAIKILPGAFTGDADRLARFEREARILAALNHPNICGIYGLEESQGVRFLILEFVEGETLASRLSRAARAGRGAGLPLPDALTIGRQIAEALEVAHDKGIVHRDLKPANVSITTQGVVKVLDFGLAKAIGGDGSAPGLTDAPDVTRSDGRGGAVIGTAAYMSPEQARGLPVDKRTDIWAFGCVLYEMLTGRVAFAGQTISDSIARILEREPDWSALPAATPAPIRRLLLRCVTKDPKQRLRDIGDVRIEIDAIDEALPGASEATASTPRRWRTALGLAIVVLSLSAAVGSWLIRDPSPASSIENLLANARFTPLTNFDGAELDAAISHDGNYVAFLADRDGPTSPFHIWLSRVGTGRFDDMTPGVRDQRNPGLLRSGGFSADGSEIWIHGTTGQRLARMPLMGGTPQVFLAERAGNVVWSRDGRQLVYFTIDAGDPMFVADGTGGNPRQIWIDATGDIHNHFPAWSPDGQWIYYAHGIQAVAEYDVWRIRASGGTPERLTNHNANVRYVTPIDARTVLYVAPDDDRSGPWLWALDVERKVTRRVSIGLERYLSVAASADGRRLVASVSTSQSASLWSVPILDRPAEENEVTPHPLPTARALAPRFGGASLFYLSSSGTGDGLWRYQDGKAVEIWKGSDGAMLQTPSVSPLGDRVAVVLMNQRRRQLTLVSADGANHNSIAETIDVRGTSAWSPNGKSIVTGGNDAQGPGLFNIPIDGGPPIRLANGPAFDPIWSPDGTLIVYSGEQRATAPLLAVRPDGSVVKLPAIRVPFSGGGRARFLPGGKGLVYMKSASVGAQALDFWLLDLSTLESRQLTRLTNSSTMNTFDVTPDGTHIIFDRVREHADVRLIDLPRK